MSRTSLIEQVPLAWFAALLMAGAVAFFLLAMPIGLIEQGVGAIGLPSVLAAATPPLGSTARALVAGSAAVFAGGTTWGLMTLADRSVRPRRRPAPRRAAPARSPAHVDAPPRRPIFANSDFGSPLPEPLPAFREMVASNDDVLELVDVIVDRVPMPEPEPEPEPAPEPAREPQAAPSPAIEEPSVASLMGRLEAGALRRAARAARNSEPAPAVAMESALRDALSELQRMAAR